MINWVFRAMIIKLTLHCILEIKHCNWNHGYWSYQNFSTEATLAKCHNCLSSFGVPASSTNRKTRMMNLTSSWDSSRKKLFEAVLAFKSLPLPIAATCVLKGRCKYDVQSAQWNSCAHPVMKRYIRFCFFHNRKAYVNGYFHATPSTVVIDEKGNMQTTVS